MKSFEEKDRIVSLHSLNQRRLWDGEFQADHIPFNEKLKRIKFTFQAGLV